DEILQMYINSVYYGEGAFGIKQAAKVYFDKDPKDLTVPESAMLVGLLPAPSTLSPISGDANKAREQQQLVLTRMAEVGYLSVDQKTQATAQQLAFAPKTAEEKHAQHFAMMVLDELKSTYGEETIIRGGYRVKTGLDLTWQKEAEKLIKDRVADLSRKGGNNASLVAIDPKTGEIRALVGSVNWEDEKFGKVNMAISPRQPGSSFKPIYYTEAMDKRLVTPATIMRDEPKTYGTYRPQNYDFRFRGNIPVRNALGQSLNIPSIEIMEKLGVESAVATAQRMGINDVNDPTKYGLTLALGTAEAKLTDMTNAYAAFANLGNQHPAVKVRMIKDKFDNTIFTNEAETKRVQSPEASFLISSILSDNEARAPTFGTSLNIPNRQVAVKTGTTDDYRDAWTIGYTPSLTVGVWVGNNDNQPMAGVAGSAGAGVIWRNSMMKFLGDSKPESFVQPVNVVKLAVCRTNGLKAQRVTSSTYDEYFIKGGEPNGSCDAPKQLEKKENKQEDKKPEDKKKEDEPAQAVTPGSNTSTEPGRGSGGSVSPTPAPTPEPQPAPQPTPTEPAPAPAPAPSPEPAPASSSP
ncbi:MAG TPA: penicillin-binding transpeptidase domain-containing protein, partial [Candidatus Limnocylindrales bacterium]|nr:penicillin-binding transpeptidase domain-containing protein [Candidatus Limnocylindrales bacterium]